MLGISYREHKTNEYVWQQNNILAGRQELSLSTVASYHGSATFCRNDTLLKIKTTEVTVDGSRCRGRPRKSWKDYIKEWTGQSLLRLLRIADDRS